jgi:hypothetical protein
MKKILTILILAIIAIISVALSGCQPAQKTQNTTITGAAYIGGEKGLELSFLANAPPNVVYDKPKEGSISPFDISVKIENKGEYSVPGGKYKISISGVDAASFGKNPNDFKGLTSTEELIKTRKSAGETIQGTFSIVSIQGLAYQSPVSGQIGPFNLRAGLCYDYQTESSSNICVLEDMLGTTRREGLCKPTEKKQVENSGAPVKVIDLEESVTGKESMAFMFIVKHIGSANNLVFKNEAQTCSIGDMTKQDKIGIKVELGTKDVTAKCSGINGGIASLYGEAGAQIRCSGTLADFGLAKGDYVQPVKITLKYDYHQYIDLPITVKQVGT